MSQQPTASNGDDRTPEEVFIARMKRERERRGWSQAVLASKVSERPRRVLSKAFYVHATAITKLEYVLQKNRRDMARNLRLNEAIAIADVFGLTVPAMLSDDDLRSETARAQALYEEMMDTMKGVQAAHEHWRSEAALLARQQAELGDLLRDTGQHLLLVNDGQVVLYDKDDPRAAELLERIEQQLEQQDRLKGDDDA